MEKYIVFNEEGEQISNLEELSGKSIEEIWKEIELLNKKFSDKKTTSKEEERNDVCIYKTLRYPPKTTPPTAN